MIWNYTTCSAQSFLTYICTFNSLIYQFIRNSIQDAGYSHYQQVFSFSVRQGHMALFLSILLFAMKHHMTRLLSVSMAQRNYTLLFCLLHKLLAICIGLVFVNTFVLMILFVRTIFHEEKRFREVAESYERMRANCTNTSSDKTTQAFKSNANNSAHEYDHSMNGISIESIPKLSSRSNSTWLSSGSNV